MLWQPRQYIIFYGFCWNPSHRINSYLSKLKWTKGSFLALLAFKVYFVTVLSTSVLLIFFISVRVCWNLFLLLVHLFSISEMGFYSLWITWVFLFLLQFWVFLKICHIFILFSCMLICKALFNFFHPIFAFCWSWNETNVILLLFKVCINGQWEKNVSS